MAESKSLLKWRKKQKRGAIMEPSTFQAIKQKAMGQGIPEEGATKVAGKAYWSSAHSKYKNRKKK